MEEQRQIPTKRSVAVVEGFPIVVEVFKDKDEKIIRQQSFTLDQLKRMKTQVATNVSRIDEMIALLPKEDIKLEDVPQG